MKFVKNPLEYVLEFLKGRLGDLLAGFVFLVATWNYYPGYLAEIQKPIETVVK